MADNAVDSTKNEEDGTDSADSKVSSSFGAHARPYTDSAPSSAQDGNQEVSSSDITESGCLSHPPKVPGTSMSPYTNAFYGNTHNAGMYTNPFVPRAPLKSDVVSTDQSNSNGSREGLLAPSRLNAAVNRDSSEVEGNRAFPKQSLLAPPKLGGAVFGGGSASHDVPSSTFNSFNSYIRPSVFSSSFDSPGLGRGAAPLLKPAKLPDPTKSCDSKADSASEAEVLSASTKSGEASSASDRLGGADGTSGGSEVSSSSASSSLPPPSISTLQSQSEGEGAVGGDNTPYNQDIVPDINKNNRLKDTSGVSSSSQSFVFGSNLSQRVTGIMSSSVENEASGSSGFVFGESLSSRAAVETNGSTQSHKDDESDSDSGAKLNQTLEESAREYQAKHENKTELKEVETITGEEEESNVLQANAKLFFFETSNESWVERGRGTIRLNDMSARDNTNFQSRLVMRTQGSLRVVLNAKIWPGMSLERASTRSIRITAMDTDESIKIFLITTNVKDSENLLRAIDWRIQQLKIQDEPMRQHSDSRVGDKRKADDSDFELPIKSKKVNSSPDQGISMTKKEESDSSVQDPETEASCESHSSSLTIKSESD